MAIAFCISAASVTAAWRRCHAVLGFGTRAARTRTAFAAATAACSSTAASAATTSAGAMGFDVFAQVIGSHEALVADGAGEAFLTRVRA